MEKPPVDKPPVDKPPVDVQNDFADWLSPMLVKELRQGVRTRAFVTVFILLQGLLLVNTSLSLLVASVQQDPSTGTIIFWLMVALPVLVVLPVTGLNAVGAEMKANTLELIFLTRLTARRIITGKWLAIFVQALLLVSTVLPYLVLRYFIGGVNLSNELAILGCMLAGSALLSACATGISGYPPRVVRALASGLSLLFFVFGVSGLQFLFGSSRVIVGASPFGVAGWVCLAAFATILLLVMLEVGAAKIAPPAENHSAALRLLAGSALAVAVAASFLVRNAETITVVGFVLAVCLGIAAICEQPRHVMSIFRPFALRGWLGRAIGKLLYPGWPSGVLFLLATFAGFGGLMAAQGMFKDPEHLVLFIALLGALLMPVALIRGCFPRTKQPVALYFGVQLACALLTIFSSICDSVLKTHFKDACAALPTCTLLLSMGAIDLTTMGGLAAMGAVTLASLVVVFLAMHRPLEQVRREETESLQLPPPAPHHAPVA